MRVKIVLLLLLIGLPVLKAQDRDLGMWISADIDLPKIGSKWEPSFNAEFRSRDNIRKVDLFSGLIMMDYVVTSFLKIGAGYEIFFNKVPEGGFGTEQRPFIGMVLHYSYYGFTISWRSRFLDTYVDIREPHWSFRNRFRLEYQIPKIPLKPFVYIEPYHNHREAFDYFHYKTRYAAGAFYRFSPHHQVSLFYLAEDYVQKVFTRHVIATGYRYSF